MKREDEKENETMATGTKTKAAEQQQLGGGTGLATTSAAPAALAMSPQDAELAALFGDTDLGGMDDGLGEVSPEDIKLALKVWNMNGIDPVTKRGMQKDVFFDTVSETTVESLDLVLLDLRKANEWREFLQAEKKSVIHCRSGDRVTGTMTQTSSDPGKVRPCKDCPDAEWKRDEEGKPYRNCGPVYAVAALDIATSQLCVLRFKRMSLAPIRAHLNKHHIARKIIAGKRSNWPLYAFTVRAKLRMDEGGIFAHIELERTGNVTAELLSAALDAKRFYSEVATKYLEKLAEKDQEAGGEAGDTNFTPSDFVDTKGEDASGSAPAFPHA